MKVGDLVRDKDRVFHTNHLGVIIEVDEYEGMFKVIWNGRGKEWLTEMYLEVIPRS
jgi:hypothetical protein